MKNDPLISIITINYKQAEVTNELLRSLSNIYWQNFEVIVVDNNSGEADINRLKLDFTFVRLIKNDRNSGFAGGNNIGIKAAKGEYIFLLNNDTTVSYNLIAPMIELFQKDKTIGAISPKIKYHHFPSVIQYAGYTKMNPFTLRMNAIGSKTIDNGQFDSPSLTPYAHGCAMMIRKDVIDQVGLMPEEYFLYYEEHDWSTRIRKAGYSIAYQPASVVYHKESISVKKDSPLKTYFLNRNRILYMRRNFKLHQKIAATLFLLTISIPKNLFTFFTTKSKAHFNAYCDALLWHINFKTKKPSREGRNYFR